MLIEAFEHGGGIAATTPKAGAHWYFFGQLDKYRIRIAAALVFQCPLIRPDRLDGQVGLIIGHLWVAAGYAGEWGIEIKLDLIEQADTTHQTDKLMKAVSTSADDFEEQINLGRCPQLHDIDKPTYPFSFM